MLIPPDPSNGYEKVAQHFIAARNSRIGPSVVKEWSKTLRPGSTILDLGCGHGVPVSQTLIEEGFPVFGVDASPTLLAAFRERFPKARAECCTVEESEFFGRAFDAVIAWGLLFLLPPDTQSLVIHKVAKVLEPDGKFLFTSPQKAARWTDSLTHRHSISLGAERYHEILQAEGLCVLGHSSDEGENYYYSCSRI